MYPARPNPVSLSLSTPTVRPLKRGKNFQAGLGRHTAEGLILLDRDFHVVALDSGAEDIIADFHGQHGTSAFGLQLPAPILELLSPSDDYSDVTYEQLKIGNCDYRCRVVLIKPRREAIQPMLAVYIRRELSVVDAVLQAAEEYGLTDREQEALVGVAMGLTSKELAERMDISPNTVKAFIRLVMIKMGASTRAAVVGILLDRNSRKLNARP